MGKRDNKAVGGISDKTELRDTPAAAAPPVLPITPKSEGRWVRGKNAEWEFKKNEFVNGD